MSRIQQREPKNILNLSTDEKRRFLNSFDHIFSDVDGVVWNMGEDIPNTGQSYMGLQNLGKKLTFITNNSVRTTEEYLSRFEKLKINVTESDIIHPALLIIEYLHNINFDGLIYAIATPRFKKLLRDEGFRVLDGPNQFIEDSYASLAKNIFDREPVRAVIIDVDFNLTSVKIMRAHSYLRHPECLLLTGATDKLLPVGKSTQIIGPGAFAQILIDTFPRAPIMLGKPGRQMCEMLIQRFQIKQPQRVLMIGDMLVQDMRFGRTCGFQTLLVLTGGCSLSQLQAETSNEQLPDYYANSVADLAELLRDVSKSNV